MSREGRDDWSKAEKAHARVVFDKAYHRECAGILAKVKGLAEEASSPEELWKIRNFIEGHGRQVGRKYDYRCSVLDEVFGTLLFQGWLSEEDLDGFCAERRSRIAGRAEMDRKWASEEKA